MFFELLTLLNKLKKPISDERLKPLYALMKENEDRIALLKKVLISLGYLKTEDQAEPLRADPYENTEAYNDFYNHSLYEKLLPLCQLAHLSENNGSAAEHAFKLSLLFNDVPQTLKYLSDYALTLKTKDSVLHDACLFQLPTPNNCEFPAWRLLAQKNLANPRFQELFPFAAELEDTAQTGKKRPQKKLVQDNKAISLKKKELEQAISNYKKESTRFIARSETAQRQERQAKLSELGAEIGQKRRELTKLSQGIRFEALDMVFLQAFYESFRFKLNEAGQSVLVNNGITPKEISRFEQLVGANDDTAIPNVFIDGKDLGYPGIYLKKLDTLSHHGRALAACLGKITHCCQFLGGTGDPCTIHGITSPDGGFYVVCRGDSAKPSLNDPIIAQSWAWRGLSQGICLDSIEKARKTTTPSEEEGIVSLYRLLGHKLCHQFNVSQVNTGAQSGITTKIALENYFTNKDHFKDYAGYCDSKSQLPLANQTLPYLFYGQTTSLAFQSIIAETTKAFFSGLFSTQGKLKTNEPLKQAIAFALQTERNDLLDLLLEIATHSLNPLHKEEYMNLLEINVAYRRELNEGKINLALIQEGACLNMFNNKGRTALHLALDESKEMVNALLALKPNLNIQDKYGNTALLYVLEQILYQNKNETGREFAESLIEAGAELDIKDHDEATPLIVAVKNNDLAMVIKLHKHGADLETFDDDMKTALFWAAEKGHLDIFNYLIKQGAKTNITSYKHETTLLMTAATSGKIELVHAILASPAFTNNLEACDKYGKTALLLATQSGNKEIFEYLENHGASFTATSKNGDNVLMLAVRSQNSALVDSLISKQPELLKQANQYGVTALMSAIVYENTSLVRTMLENPVCRSSLEACNSNGDSALMMAATAGCRDIFECLSKSGASFAVTNHAGENVLMTAITNGHYELAEFILATHPELLDQISKSGETALIKAIDCGQNQLVRAILTNPFCSSKILTHRHRKNMELESPLLKVVKQKDLGLVELILNHPNANLSLLEQTCFEPSPLFLAVKNGLSDIAKTIIASPYCTSEALFQRFSYDGSILNMAAQSGQIEVVKAILANPQCTSEVLLQNPSLLLSTFGDKREITLAILQSKPMSSELLCATNADGNTILTLAAKMGDKELVELICASPHYNTSLLMQENKVKQNALAEAMLGGHKEAVQTILRSPHCQNNTRQQYKNYSLLLAVKNQDFAKVQELVEEGVSPDSVEYMGQTALSTAAKTGQADIFNYLVSNGANINKYLLNPVINFIDNAIEKANLVNELNIPLVTRLEVINKLYEFKALLQDKLQQANTIEISSILDDLNKVMQTVKAAKFSGPLLRLKLNVSQESNTAAKMMEDRHKEVLHLLSQITQTKPQEETQLTRNNYIMEPIINFVKITSLKLEENNASPETRSMFQSFLQETQEYVLNCKEDISDCQVIFKKLFPLVAAVSEKQNTYSFFAQKNSDLHQECRSVIEEVDKRIAYSQAKTGPTN